MTQPSASLRPGPGKFTITLAGLAAVWAASRLLRKSPIEAFGGKVVLIAGGSRGLGLAIAREFLDAGSKLVLVARDAKELERGRLQLGFPAEVATVALDLCEATAATEMVRQATERFGAVDVLVNCASFMHIGPIELQPEKVYRDSMELGYFAYVRAVKAVLPQMQSRGSGHIINICSIGGKIPVPHLGPYVGTKFATVGFSETLRAELAGGGVNVLTVCPGLMRTGSFPRALVVGDVEKEYRWFSLGAVIPGLSHSAAGAARKIVQAAAQGCAETFVGVEASLASRFHGLAPSTFQAIAAAVNRWVLPKSEGTNQPVPATDIRAPENSLFRSLAKQAIEPNNQVMPR